MLALFLASYAAVAKQLTELTRYSRRRSVTIGNVNSRMVFGVLEEIGEDY